MARARISLVLADSGYPGTGHTAMVPAIVCIRYTLLHCARTWRWHGPQMPPPSDNIYLASMDEEVPGSGRTVFPPQA